MKYKHDIKFLFYYLISFFLPTEKAGALITINFLHKRVCKAMAKGLSCLERPPLHQGSRFDPCSELVQEATNECINKRNNKSMSVSLSKINQ